MNPHELKGTTVMVSPVLWTSDRCGELGSIAEYYVDGSVSLLFDDEETERFSAKQVFMLQKPDLIYQDIQKNASMIWQPVADNLKKVALLQYGSGPQINAAWDLVRDDPDLHVRATIRLNEYLSQANSPNTSQNVMKNFENLNGSLVLIHPNLDSDPAHKGKVGIVTYSRDADDITVGMINGTENTYKAKDLLLLKEKPDLMKVLEAEGSKMHVDDFKAMFKMMMLQDKGTPTAKVNAIEIAATRPALLDKVFNSPMPGPIFERAKSMSR